MVKFGDTTLPHVLTIKQQDSTILQEIPLPYRRTAYRKWLGGKGLMFNIGGYMKPTDDITPSILRSLADGVPRALDLESTELVRLESAQRYQTGPPVVWTNNTAEAKTPGGTPFTLLGATSDYYYFGHAEKWNQISFDLQALGIYADAIWEYSQGNGAWGVLDLDTLHDDFLGSSLDTTKWVPDGSPTVAGGYLILNSATGDSVISVSALQPFYQSIMSIKPNEVTDHYFIFPVYIDDNNFIWLHFYSNGHLYFKSSKGGIGSEVDVGAYDTSKHDYRVTWTPTSVNLFCDESLLYTFTEVSYIPTAAAKFKMTPITGQFSVDYVKYQDIDGTLIFTQDGSLPFAAPTDWAIDVVNAITNKFWLRCKASSVTTPATVNEIWLQQIYNCLMLDPQFTESAEAYNRIDYSLTFAQQENP